MRAREGIRAEEGRHGARVGERACPIYPIRPKETSRGFFSEFKVLFTHSCVAARGQSVSEPWARASCAACAHLHAAPPSLPPYHRALRAPRSSSHRPRPRPSPPAARPRAARPRLPLHRRRRTRSYSTGSSTEGRPTTTYRARAWTPRFTTSASAVSTPPSWRTGRAARGRRTPWKAARAASTGKGLFRGRVNSFRTPLSRHPFLLPSSTP